MVYAIRNPLLHSLHVLLVQPPSSSRGSIHHGKHRERRNHWRQGSLGSRDSELFFVILISDYSVFMI